ncbi:MAG: ABC transporter substrate-binding protein [Lachnospiraceae bacterium]|nr:ABC transporter substrate-binding protein [Lachnospiraceae bacterium]
MKKTPSALALALTGALLLSLTACSSSGSTTETTGTAENETAGTTAATEETAQSDAESTEADTADTAESTTETVSITLCLDWTPNTNHTGIYVAEALGYYEEAGLDVTIVQPPEDGALQTCASGQAQFAISSQDLMAQALDLDEPLPLTAVAAILQHNSSGLITRAEDNITTAADMEGYSYATWNDATELAILEYLVEADGGNFDNVTLIPNIISDEAAALSAHQADIIWVYEGWSVVNADLEGLDYNFMRLRDLDEVFDYYSPLLIANDDFLESNPEAAKAFIAATKKGYEYAVENVEEAAQMLIDGDTTGSLDDSTELVYASQEILSQEYVDDAESWGVIDLERWDTFYSWLYENGLIENEMASGTGFSADYLE